MGKKKKKLMEWTLEPRKLSELREHPYNPRELTKHAHEHLTLSISTFGLIDKPIINLDNLIIGGHQRVKILKELGETEVLCWVPEKVLTVDEIDDLLIRLNANIGRWDHDILGNHFELTQLLASGMQKTELGFDIKKDVDLDKEGSETPKGKKIKIMECPHCLAHFEQKQAKVVDKGD